MRRALILPFFAALATSGCSERIADRPMNFGVVEHPSDSSGGIYRGGSPSPVEIAALRQALDIRTIVRLSRGDASAERAAARLAGVTLIEIPIDPKKLGTADSATRDAAERAVQAISDPRNWPVYVHCDHGRDRTGYVVALYRARSLGWAWPAISEELMQHGHGPFMRRYLPDITRQLMQEVSGRGAQVGS